MVDKSETGGLGMKDKLIEEKPKEPKTDKYGTFHPRPTKKDIEDGDADQWVDFARSNPDDFLNIIIDDFASLRLVQALFVTASVGLVRSSMGHNSNDLQGRYAQKMGVLGGLSVFCNLFGIVLAIAVNVQCRGMKEMKVGGEQVVAALPKLFTLFYITMMSFVLGMLLMAASVCVLLFTTESYEMSIAICIFASMLFIMLLCLVSKYTFGTSLTTHALQLATSSVQNDLEKARQTVAAPVGGVTNLLQSSCTKQDSEEAAEDDMPSEKPIEKPIEKPSGKPSGKPSFPKPKEAEADPEDVEKPDEKAPVFKG